MNSKVIGDVLNEEHAEEVIKYQVEYDRASTKLKVMKEWYLVLRVECGKNKINK